MASDRIKPGTSTTAGSYFNPNRTRRELSDATRPAEWTGSPEDWQWAYEQMINRGDQSFEDLFGDLFDSRWEE